MNSLGVHKGYYLEEFFTLMRSGHKELADDTAKGVFAICDGGH